jgi:ribosomal protein S18 acetylase RimI-like enzyme
MIAPTSPSELLLPPYRKARKADADALCTLINFAGEGLPMYLWSRMAGEGESAWDIGRQRACREDGGFSYRNAIVREDKGQAIAALIGYPIAPVPEPWLADKMPPMFVPLQQLEDLAASTWYVNVLAVSPDQRGRGCGSELLAMAEQCARQAGCPGLSIIVSDANTGARRLYERTGYVERAMRPMVKEGWKHDGCNWVLLVREI